MIINLTTLAIKFEKYDGKIKITWTNGNITFATPEQAEWIMEFYTKEDRS